MGGYWTRARSGYEYREHRWVQRGNGQWAMVGGNWERRGPNGDRDHDGIPNRYDNRNDNRNDSRNGHRMGPNGDRDGDGVPNSRDRAPDNPRRS